MHSCSEFEGQPFLFDSGLLKDSIEAIDEHAIQVVDEMAGVWFLTLLNVFDKCSGLLLNPDRVRTETSIGDKDFTSPDMQENQYKALAISFRRPDSLGEEVALPQRVGMNREKLVPAAFSTFGAWLEAVSLEYVLHGRS